MLLNVSLFVLKEVRKDVVSDAAFVLFLIKRRGLDRFDWFIDSASKLFFGWSNEFRGVAEIEFLGEVAGNDGNDDGVIDIRVD